LINVYIKNIYVSFYKSTQLTSKSNEFANFRTAYEYITKSMMRIIIKKLKNHKLGIRKYNTYENQTKNAHKAHHSRLYEHFLF